MELEVIVNEYTKNWKLSEEKKEEKLLKKLKGDSGIHENKLRWTK